ncbi:MAG: nucleoside deaminase [Pseudomonadota bacterium]
MAFRSFMSEALEAAQEAFDADEVPVGAVIVKDGTVIAKARNETRGRLDATAHAEMLVLQQAMAALGQERLEACDLYVTLEPCAMCAGAIAHARIRRLYFGASDPKSGGVIHGARVFDAPQSHHRPEIYEGVGEAACAALLKDFFATKRGS